MIKIEKKEACCGCNACGDICPTKAISFVKDNEGFWYPLVDSSKCINCSLCERVCPILHFDKMNKNDLSEPVCYAAVNNDMNVLFDSTSGGLFSVLAEQMYSLNGFVGGAVFNEDLTVSHFISSNSYDLPRLRSSKYLQSCAIGFYKKKKKLVNSKEKVLVCGTPCQMAALQSYLGKKYDNLIVVDFICRGVNSPKVWLKYLKSFEERYGSKVVFAKAKSKEYGWRNLTQMVRLANGKEIFETKETSYFMQGYLNSNLYCRQSCYDCRFKGIPRISDITLADFWGIEKCNIDFDKNLGTSIVLINSKNGMEFFEQIKHKVSYTLMPIKSILEDNMALVNSIKPPKKNRNEFFRDIDSMSFTDLSKKYIKAHEKSFVLEFKQYLRIFWKYGLFFKRILKLTRCNPTALYQTLKYSGFSNLLKQQGIIFSKNCSVNISPKAILDIQGLLVIGEKGHFPTSKLESRLFVDEGATLQVLGNVTFSYGCDIEVFKNAKLIFQGNRILPATWANINCTIICGERIEIEADVIMGRGVTIRDNNGGHYINKKDYKNSNSIIIGEKSWLCEQCLIMPGVHLGFSTVVAARSLVLSKSAIPAHSFLAGSPARIMSNDIRWKC